MMGPPNAFNKKAALHDAGDMSHAADQVYLMPGAGHEPAGNRAQGARAHDENSHNYNYSYALKRLSPVHYPTSLPASGGSIGAGKLECHPHLNCYPPPSPSVPPSGSPSGACSRCASTGS